MSSCSDTLRAVQSELCSASDWKMAPPPLLRSALHAQSASGCSSICPAAASAEPPAQLPSVPPAQGSVRAGRGLQTFRYWCQRTRKEPGLALRAQAGSAGLAAGLFAHHPTQVDAVVSLSYVWGLCHPPTSVSGFVSPSHQRLWVCVTLPLVSVDSCHPPIGVCGFMSPSHQCLWACVTLPLVSVDSHHPPTNVCGSASPSH